MTEPEVSMFNHRKFDIDRGFQLFADSGMRTLTAYNWKNNYVQQHSPRIHASYGSSQKKRNIDIASVC